MDTNRSFLDNLNAGRTRRPGSALEHISRTLQEIEQQLDRAYSARASREDGSRTEAPREPEMPAVAPSEEATDRAAANDEPKHRALHDLVSEFQRTRDRGSDLATMETIAAEVRSLRDELQTRHAGMYDELRTLRADLRRFDPVHLAGGSEGEVATELERLSAKISALDEHSGDRTLQLLRLDMEQLRAALDSLAREDTVRSVGRRWEELAVNGGVEGEAAEALAMRLEQIAKAVQSLPDTQALRSLDDKVRALAGALDQFIEHSSQARPDLHELIDERLDEISRAIAATAADAKAPHFDPAPLERIEARVASLARQVEEIVEENQSAQVVERLAALAARVDQIAERVEIPGEAIKEMAAQIAAISTKVEQAATAADPDQLYDEIERRVAALSQTMERNHEAVLVHGERLIGEVKSQIGELAGRIDSLPQSGAMPESIMETLNARFEELSARIETRAGGLDEQAFASIETRLEDLALRLKESASQVATLDPQLVRELQKQIGGLAEHLAEPGNLLPDFEDLGPRLARIELSLAENQETVIEAARRTAEETLSSLREAPASSEGGVDLSAEIKALETLARRADDRNARTFEAIHDTLLKIVERLSTLESETTDVSGQRETVKLAVGAAPSLDPIEEEAIEEMGRGLEATEPAEENGAELDFGHEPESQHRLTPAEAAAAAAEAALSGQAEAEPAAAPEKRSMLGGLTRAFAQRKDRAAAAPTERKEPSVDEAPRVENTEPALDGEQANEPLEPGSGAPDLNAIMRRVRDEGLQATRHSEGDAAKADFIAAARRAAQAAAAEAETLKRKKSGESRGSTGRFRGLLRSRKSAALMAVAAVAIVAGGIGAVRFLAPAPSHSGKVALAVPAKMTPAAAKTTAAQAKSQAASTKAAAVPARAPASSATKDPEPAASPAPAATPDRKMSMEAAPAESASAPAKPVALHTASFSPKETAADNAEPETAAKTNPTGPQASAAANEAQKNPATATRDKETASLGALPESLGPLPLRQAALNDDPKALFAVAEHYSQGHGVKADAATASKYYEKAAEAGLAPAQYRIGNNYEKGIGVERDIAKAKEWYRKAAEQGNASAMHNLGVLYAMGAGGTADNDEAVKWFSKAAALGVKDSQFNLGILSAKGVGVKRDLEEAYKWFALVAKTGDKDAAAKRDEIAKALDAQAVKEAKAKAELWKPKPLDRAANVVDLPAEWTDGKTTAAAVDMKKAVTNIQLILNKNGYSAGPADGVMGEKTKSAIIAFQKDNGLDATGKVDTELVQALLAHK